MISTKSFTISCDGHFYGVIFVVAHICSVQLVAFLLLQSPNMSGGQRVLCVLFYTHFVNILCQISYRHIFRC